jgi:Pyruvate/2-oxoacid:ferredoxin oxidoreductase gamma subunit
MMPDKDIVNILIAGTGGQGVNTLYRVILNLCLDHNLYSKSALFKGGAQRHGTVYASIRIFLKDDPGYRWYSSQVPPHGLDVLIGLEPWETLRFRQYMGKQTHTWTNTHEVPLFSQRFLQETPGDPLEMLKGFGDNIRYQDYTGLALQKYGDNRMANYLIGKDVMESGILPFAGQEFTNRFISDIKPEKRIENLIMEEIK